MSVEEAEDGVRAPRPPAGDAAPAAAPQPLPLRKNRDFQILWTGQAISVLGTTVTQIAYPLLVLALTGSAAYAGLVGTLEMVVFLLATLPAGVIADRYNRRVIMIACDAGRALVLGGLALLVFTGHAEIWHIVLAATLSSVGDGLFGPAARGARKQIVPASQLSTAAAAQEGRGAAAIMVGPPLGGWLFSVARGVPFLFDAATYLVGAVSLLFIRRPLQAERGTEHAEPLWKGSAEGFRFILKRPVLRALIAWAIIINMGFAGVPIVLIAAAKSRGANDSVVGAMIMIMGIGMLLGAVATPRMLKLLSPSALVYLCAWFTPLGLAVLVLIQSPILLGVMVGVIVFFVPPLNSMLGGYAGAMTPDALQGRVGAATSLGAQGFKPVGPLLLGVVYESFGPGWALGTAALIAAVAAAFTLDKDVRGLRRPEEVAVE